MRQEKKHHDGLSASKYYSMFGMTRDKIVQKRLEESQKFFYGGKYSWITPENFTEIGFYTQITGSQSDYVNR